MTALDIPATVPTPESLRWPRLGEQGYEPGVVEKLCAQIEANHHLSDQRLLLLLKAWFQSNEHMDKSQRARVESVILGYHYDFATSGFDSVRTWSESRQITFAVCEYLAGREFPETIFTDDDAPGHRHMGKARLTIMSWLSDRFRFGFSEWLSINSYSVNIVALTLLVDHCDDPDLALRASMVLDLLFTDIALHQFDGHFAAASARVSPLLRQHPERSAAQAIINAALRPENMSPESMNADDADGSGAKRVRVSCDQLNAIFLCRERYRVPAAIREIAAIDTTRVLTSQGLGVDEVRQALAGHPQFPRKSADALTRFWWGMQAFTAPDAAVTALTRRKGAKSSAEHLLPRIADIMRVPAPFRSTALRLLRPVTDGMAMQRANVQTFRTPDYLLSSAQRYHPGEFGDQQNLWQASLPGGISVFGNHPTNRLVCSPFGPESPATPPTTTAELSSVWVGNGVNPDIAQRDNLLLVQYDLAGRRGHFEGPRRHFTHIHFPFASFDDTRVGTTWVAGVKANSYIGVVASSRLYLNSETEVVQRGVRTGYVVVLGDAREFATLTEFTDELKRYRVGLRGKRLNVRMPYGRAWLDWKGSFHVDGHPVSHDYPRYKGRQVVAERNPSAIAVNGSGHLLMLDWEMGTREETPLVS